MILNEFAVYAEGAVVVVVDGVMVPVWSAFGSGRLGVRWVVGLTLLGASGLRWGSGLWMVSGRGGVGAGDGVRSFAALRMTNGG